MFDVTLGTYSCKKCWRSEEHTSELQSRSDLVCRLLLEKKKNNIKNIATDLKRLHEYQYKQSTPKHAVTHIKIRAATSHCIATIRTYVGSRCHHIDSSRR